MPHVRRQLQATAKTQKRPQKITHQSLTTPTQNTPTIPVVPAARSAAPSASAGARSVCATNRYVRSAAGSVNVSGAIVSRASDAAICPISAVSETKKATNSRSAPKSGVRCTILPLPLLPCVCAGTCGSGTSRPLISAPARPAPSQNPTPVKPQYTSTYRLTRPFHASTYPATQPTPGTTHLATPTVSAAAIPGAPYVLSGTAKEERRDGRRWRRSSKRERKRREVRRSAERQSVPSEGPEARMSAAWIVCVEVGGGGGRFGLCRVVRQSYVKYRWKEGKSALGIIPRTNDAGSGHPQYTPHHRPAP